MRTLFAQRGHLPVLNQEVEASPQRKDFFPILPDIVPPPPEQQSQRSTRQQSSRRRSQRMTQTLDENSNDEDDGDDEDTHPAKKSKPKTSSKEPTKLDKQREHPFCVGVRAFLNEIIPQVIPSNLFPMRQYPADQPLPEWLKAWEQAHDLKNLVQETVFPFWFMQSVVRGMRNELGVNSGLKHLKGSKHLNSRKIPHAMIRHLLYNATVLPSWFSDPEILALYQAITRLVKPLLTSRWDQQRVKNYYSTFDTLAATIDPNPIYSQMEDIEDLPTSIENARIMTMKATVSSLRHAMYQIDEVLDDTKILHICLPWLLLTPDQKRAYIIYHHQNELNEVSPLY